MQNQSLLEVGMFWPLHCIYNNHEQLDKSQDNGHLYLIPVALFVGLFAKITFTVLKNPIASSPSSYSYLLFTNGMKTL